MNFLEALNSGKPFRRKGEHAWHTEEQFQFSRSYMLKDDFETKNQGKLKQVYQKKGPYSDGFRDGILAVMNVLEGDIYDDPDNGDSWSWIIEHHFLEVQK